MTLPVVFSQKLNPSFTQTLLGLVATVLLSAPPALATEPTNDSDDSCSHLLKAKALSLSWIAEQTARTKGQSETLERLRSAAQTTSFHAVALNRQVLAQHHKSYTFELKNQCVTDQGGTGRCWIFAAQSVMRASIMRSQLLAPDFEISENHVWFFSLLERANYHMEGLFKFLYRRATPTELQTAAIASIDEGGYFPDFDEIVRKYGIVPKAAMDETSASTEGEVVTQEMEMVLHQFGIRFLELRAIIDEIKEERGGSIQNEVYDRFQNKLREEKARAMEAIWDILVTHLGLPPTKFKLRFDSFNRKTLEPKFAGLQKSSSEIEMTPQDLLKLTGYADEEWITISHYPLKEMNQLYRFKPSLETVQSVPEEGESPRALELFNLPIERMLELTKQAMDEGLPVEFDADIGKDTDYESGVLNTELYKKDAIYGGLVNRDELNDSRAKLGQFGVSHASHAMVFVGYDQPDTTQPILKLKVQNSWGKEIGDQGYFHMYRNWFEKYVFHITIPKRLLSEQEKLDYDYGPEHIEWHELFHE